MNNISMVESKLPPGFRFHPRDEELVCDYLTKKVTHSDSLLMVEVDLNKCEPWEIPASACVGGKEWYFYSQRDRKYATGLRTNRATSSGYWKATGKDRTVLRKGTLVGMRKTLVFYQGRAPKGRKSNWVMHEFRLEGPLSPPKLSSHKEDWVLCRVFYKDKETMTGQSSKESFTCNDQKSSSSLPALTDSYISFDQTQSNNFYNYHDQQVSCFSILSQNQTNPSFSHTFTHQIDQSNNISTTIKNTIGFGGLGMNNSTISPSYLDPLACDKKILKAVLDQLTKVESNNTSIKESPSFGEGSSESFLSEVGMPNMWSTRY